MVKQYFLCSIILITTLIAYNEASLISDLIAATHRSTVHLINFKNHSIPNFMEIKIAHQIFDIRKIKISKGKKIEVTVLAISSSQEFEEFYKNIKPETFRYDGHFIILCETKIEIEFIFEKMWKLWIFNVNVLMMDSVTIPMYSFYPFTENSCNNTKATKINEFYVKSSTWKNQDFFPIKFKDLHGCVIRVGSFQKSPFFIVERNKRKFSGIDVDFIEIFGDVLNFTPRFFEKDQQIGAIFKNNTSTGLLGYAYRNELDLVTGSLSLQQSRVEFLTATKTIYSDKLILVIPPPFLIDSLLKIYMPFSNMLWICITTVVLIACTVIVILKFTPQYLHDYIIGKEVEGRILNVWAHLFGGVQKQLPKSTFPRFLLAKFLIFALIIRSLYQGAIYNLLKEDISTIEIKKIDELIEHKFTFFIYESLASRLKDTKFMERHKIISLMDLDSYELKTRDPAFKGAVFSYLTSILYKNIQSRKQYTLKICQENLLTNQFVFYFSKNFYIVNDFNKLMGYIRAAGFVDHVISKYIDMKMIKEGGQKQAPSPLNFDHLQGIFELLIFGQIAAFIAFIMEIIYGKLKTKIMLRKTRVFALRWKRTKTHVIN